MRHGPGSVILPCQEQARWHLFTRDLRRLGLPEGSGIIFGTGASIVGNLNSAIDLIPDESEWIWLIGDDHTFEPDTVLRLLEHNLDVVACLCVRRQPPFQLVHYTGPMLTNSDAPLLKTLQITDIPMDGEPFEVYASGTSGMLVRRHVLEAIGKPAFASTDGESQNEEFEFCRRVKEAGYRVYVDPSCVLGHLGMMKLTPRLKDGEWGLELAFGMEGFTAFKPGGLQAEDLMGMTV